MENEKIKEAKERLDELFLECGWSADHPAMKDWATIKFALMDLRKIRTE